MPPRNRRVLAAAEGARARHGGAAGSCCSNSSARSRACGQTRTVVVLSTVKEETYIAPVARGDEPMIADHDGHDPDAPRPGSRHAGHGTSWPTATTWCSTSTGATAAACRTPAAARGPRHVLVLRPAAGGHQPPEARGPRVPREAAARGADEPDQLRHLHRRVRRVRGDFGRVGIPPSLPHMFFVDGGALGVENALKAAFDWKVRSNFARG